MPPKIIYLHVRCFQRQLLILLRAGFELFLVASLFQGMRSIINKLAYYISLTGGKNGCVC